MIALVWPFAIACMYVIRDPAGIVNPKSGFPLIELYYQATGSKAATVVLLTAFAFCLFGSAVANITGSSRQIWAASRDQCYPLSKWWTKVDPRSNMPLNAACLTGAFVTVSEPCLRVIGADLLTQVVSSFTASFSLARQRHLHRWSLPMWSSC